MDPWHDTPPCPFGCGTCVIPIAEVERGRWYGPDDANLFCCACGHGFIGTPDDVAKAVRANDAYLDHLSQGAT